MALVQADLMALLQDPSAKTRANVAAQLSHSFCRDSFTQTETQLAIDIFRVLIKDTATQVRKAMADHLHDNPNVPKDIIVSLASDITDVSLIVLENSLVLEDDDLLQIIEAAQQVEKWLAIARRQKLSRKVALSLVSTKHLKTVATVVENNGADFKNDDVVSLLREYGGNQTIMEALVFRGGLSPVVAEALYSKMSTLLKKNITKQSMISWNAPKDIATAARDSLVVRFLLPHMSRPETDELLINMHRGKRLSFILLIRALCYGEVYFFEVGMAEVAGLSVSHARMLMRDPTGFGIETILQGKHMPIKFAKGLNVIYRIACEITDNGAHRVDDFSGQVIDHIHANGYDEKIENIPFFLSILKQNYVRNTAH